MPNASSLTELFDNLPQAFQPDKAEGMDAIFQFDLTGDNGGKYWVKVVNQQIEVHEGEHEDPTMTMTATADDFIALASGELNPMMAFMQGKIKVKGDMGLALKLQTVLGLG